MKHEHGRRLVGHTLSLDKFANAKVSKFNKKEKLEKQRALNAKKVNKYAKLKRRLEAAGELPARHARVPLPDDMHGGSGSESEEGGAAAPRQRPRQHLQQLAGSGAAPQAHRHEQRQHRDGRPSADNAQPAQQQQQKDNQQQQQQRHEPGQQQQGRPQSAAGRPADAKGRPAKPLSRLQRLALQKQQEKAEAERAKEAARKAAAEKRSAIEAAQKARKTQKHNFFRKTQKGQPLMKFRIDKILETLEKK